MKTFLKRTAIILICLVGFWCILLSLRKPWIEPIPGVRLEPTRPILLEKDVKPDSAFDLLRRAGAAYTVPQKQEHAADDEWKHMPWSLNGATNTLAVLEQAQESLALARRAAEAPDPQVPTETNIIQTLPYITKMGAICRCFNMSAKVKTVQGDYPGAFSNLRIAISFSSILSRGGVLIDHLVSIACCDMSCRTMRQIASNYPVEEDLLRDNIRFLETTDNESEPFVECMRYEWIFAHASIDECFNDPLFFARGRSSKPRRAANRTIACLLGSKPGNMEKDMDACYTHLIIMAEKPYDPAAYDRFDKLLGPEADISLLLNKTSGYHSDSSPVPLISLLQYKDPIGRVLAQVLLSGTGKGHSKYVTMIADLRATRIFLAVVMFKRDEGRLPQKLDELTPKYLDNIPDDPFDGKQMKYRLNPDGTWVVYSVGIDGKDDGGVEDSKLGRGKPDLTFGPT